MLNKIKTKIATGTALLVGTVAAHASEPAAKYQQILDATDSSGIEDAVVATGVVLIGIVIAMLAIKVVIGMVKNGAGGR